MILKRSRAICWLVLLFLVHLGCAKHSQSLTPGQDSPSPAALSPTPQSAPETPVAAPTPNLAEAPVKGFPSDVPLPADLKIIGVHLLEPAAIHVLDGRVPANLEMVAAQIRAAAPSLGWSESPGSDRATGAVKLLVFNKDGRTLSATLLPQEEGTYVNIKVWAGP